MNERLSYKDAKTGSPLFSIFVERELILQSIRIALLKNTQLDDAVITRIFELAEMEYKR